MNFRKKITAWTIVFLVLVFFGQCFTASGANLNAIKQQTKASWIVSDAQGIKYNVSLFSANAKKTITLKEAVWAGANAGDIIYDGDFSIAIGNVKSDKLLSTSSVLKGFQYNATRKMAYIIKSSAIGQPDLIALAQTESSSNDSAKLFYIAGGKLKNVKIKAFGDFADAIYYVHGAKPKAIEKNNYQTVEYSNGASVGFSFNTYSFSPATGILTNMTTTSFFNKDYDLGNTTYQKWINDPAYFFKPAAAPEKDY